jgi:hypothetical protein
VDFCRLIRFRRPSSIPSGTGDRHLAKPVQDVNADQFGSRGNGHTPVVPVGYRDRGSSSRIAGALVALCSGYILVAGAAAGANDGSSGTQGLSAVGLDQVTETLLGNMEEQIANGHLVSPPDDNAVETWRRVLRREMETPVSSGYFQALMDFEAHAVRRAAAEKAAGRTTVATALIMFANQAGRLVAHEPTGSTMGATTPAIGSVSRGFLTDHAAPSAVARTDASKRDEPAGGPTGAATLAPTAATSAESSSGSVADPEIDVYKRSSSPLGVTDATRSAIIGEILAGSARAGALAGPVDARSPESGARAIRSSDAPEPIRAGTDEDANATGAGVTSDHIATASIGPAGGAVISSPEPARDVPPVADGADVISAPSLSRSAIREPVVAGPATSGTKSPLAPLEQGSAAIYISRGDEMLARKDISAARKFYEFAATAGSASAAASLAKTYDPTFTARIGLVGLKADLAQATFWYQKAAAAGDPDALAWLVRKPTEAAR